jgi:hypothetical protein
MLLEAFRGAPEGALLEEAAAEALATEMGSDEGFDLDQEFADALAQIREAGRKKRIDRLLALDRSQGLTAEQKQLLVRELAASRIP